MASASPTRETLPSKVNSLEREVKRLKRDMRNMEQNVLAPTDAFKRHFDIPSLPSTLVFDFESFDDDNRVSTPESILLNSVLHLKSRGSWQGATALGTHGMGGVGKTSALKGICSSENVQSLFEDGTCFMEFGENATLQKVREEVCRCVQNFGGFEAAKEMRRALNLGDVVKRAAEWLKDKAVLLVCDDLWATNDSELGYVPELKRMLRDAPKSGLLISTRDRTIARAVSSSPVNFECADPQGPRARDILGIAAFGVDWQQMTPGWEAESEYVKILTVCAGLPLALGIAGRGVNLDYEDSGDGEGRKDASFAVKTYWEGLSKGSVKHLRGANADYHRDGLKYVVEASLKSCEAWGRNGGREYDMGRLFRSLCILEKQQFLPESTLKLYWRFEGLDELGLREVVRKFANLNLVKRERVDGCIVKVKQYCVRLHDLVLELCKTMKVNEQQAWHIGLLNAYRLVLEDGKVIERGGGAWWKIEDDGHISANLSRHLIASGCWAELEALLCDVRWTLRRYETGGWAALDLDFKRFIACEGGSENHGIRQLHSMLRSCWAQLRVNERLLGFYAFGYFSKEERQDRNISEYLKSVEKHLPSPWLCPLTKCVGPEDSRESSRWNIGDSVLYLAVASVRDRVVFASPENIYIWSLSRQEELFKISTDDFDATVYSVALSEDAKIIVSGHADGTVRRWNAQSGELVGEPMSRHSYEVNCLAIRGNLIVSRSFDGLLYRWNATTGESIGNALKGHGGFVTCVALSADSKLIVSVSRDGTIRKWEAGTGDPVGSPLKMDQKEVTCLAISSDGELLVSGHEDGTVRRWRTNTGQAVGERLGDQYRRITGVAVSEDGNHIVSRSDNGVVCLWDVSSGEAIGIPLRGYGGRVTCIAVSRDGKLVMSGSSDGNLRHWDVLAGRSGSVNHRLLTSRYEYGTVSFRSIIDSLSVCGNRKIVVSGSLDGTVQMWNVLTGEAVGRPMLGDPGQFRGKPVAINRNGTLIVSGGGDCGVRRWNASTGKAIGEPLNIHSKLVSAIVITDDGEHIVTGSRDGTVSRWDARTGEEVGKPMKHSGGDLRPIRDLAVSTDGKLIVSGALGSLERWDATTGEQIGDYIKVPGRAENITISNDGETIACGSFEDDYVQKWETKTGKPACELMKWSYGEHILYEMKQPRQCDDQECDVFVRKETFPVEMRRTAISWDHKKYFLGLDNGKVAICERR